MIGNDSANPSNNKTTFPMSSTLHLAISTNCECFVRKLLKDGADANQALKVESVGDYYKDRSVVSPSECIFRHDDEVEYRVFPIHVAIMNCYFNCRHGPGQNQRNAALGIVRALLEFNADPAAPCYGIHFVRLGEAEFGTYVASAETGRAFNLIASLKEYPFKGYADECRDMMDELSFILLHEEKKDVEHGTIVPYGVKSIWAHLLNHNTYNDFTFVCQDGTRFPAHRAVLSAASDYFTTAFEGPWKESSKKGEWPTSKPPAVIRLMLTYIYTGEFNVEVFNEFSKEALETAFEFSLPFFQDACERHCAKHLNSSSVRSLLLLASMYDATTLKAACFQFVDLNWKKVMFDPSVLSLSKDYPDLWKELAQHCTPVTEDDF
jgi:hypothetical protein